MLALHFKDYFDGGRSKEPHIFELTIHELRSLRKGNPSVMDYCVMFLAKLIVAFSKIHGATEMISMATCLPGFRQHLFTDKDSFGLKPEQLPKFSFSLYEDHHIGWHFDRNGSPESRFKLEQVQFSLQLFRAKEVSSEETARIMGQILAKANDKIKREYYAEAVELIDRYGLHEQVDLKDVCKFIMLRDEKGINLVRTLIGKTPNWNLEKSKVVGQYLIDFFSSSQYIKRFVK